MHFGLRLKTFPVFVKFEFCPKESWEGSLYVQGLLVPSTLSNTAIGGFDCRVLVYVPSPCNCKIFVFIHRYSIFFQFFCNTVLSTHDRGATVTFANPHITYHT
uniref:Uncharacterized protein n=1 Tax=Anguilla anguilla TaxID=7936 RepID=A0A0E9WUA5_ANGAN